MLPFLKDLHLPTCLQNKEASAAEKSPEGTLLPVKLQASP